jgi:hypothetical protein
MGLTKGFSGFLRKPEMPLRLGGEVMTLRDLSQLDLKRQQYRAILYLAEGGASFE